MQRSRCTPVLLALLCLLALPARAQFIGSDVTNTPLLDQIELEVIGRDLVAFGAGGGDVRERLHIGERLRWIGSRGAVGVAITDQRVLVVGTGSAIWQERRYERGESVPGGAMLGDRVGLVTTNRRAIGFNAETGAVPEYRLGPQEEMRTSGVGAQVGVVVTNRNALGLSPVRDTFQARDLQIHEQVENVLAHASLATIRTSQRVLVFRANTGAWSERRREIHE